MAGKGKETPYEYVRGTNAHLDALLEEGERVFIVNRSKGRKPVSAESIEEALEKYERMYGK